MNLFSKFSKSKLGETSFGYALRLLSKRDRRLILAVTFLQIGLGALDLVGVLVIGVVGSLSISGIASGKPGDRTSAVLEFLGIQGFGLQSQVAILGAVAAGFLVIKTMLSMFLNRRIIFFLAIRSAKISEDLILRFFALPSLKVTSMSQQEAIASLTSGVKVLLVGVLSVWINLISDLTLLIVMGVGLFLVDTSAAVGALCLFGGIAVVLHFLLQGRVRKFGQLQSKLEIASAEGISNAILGAKELTVHNRRHFVASQIVSKRFHLAKAGGSLSFLQSISKYLLELALVLGALSLAGYQFLTNSASRAVGIVAIFIAASTRITPAVLRVQQGMLGIRGSMGMAYPTINLIHELTGINRLESDARRVERKHEGFSGDVKLRNVSFRYEDREAGILSVDLVAKAGQFIGIAGSTGSGKSTLLDVILGLKEPLSGTISISGLEPLEAFRKFPGAISYVPQEPLIIKGTVRENLAFGYDSSDFKEDDFWQVLEKAELASFVEELPLALDTPLGERGTNVSGGQRQRLGIARALITMPKILVLDESTSALDAATEANITSSVLRNRSDLTLIVVAHRLSTLLDADRIYFMEDGKVANSGSFQELKQSNLLFREQAEAMGL
jgi:ABC-type multidrug transport system fused ATPase/permease subunit